MLPGAPHGNYWVANSPDPWSASHPVLCQPQTAWMKSLLGNSQTATLWESIALVSCLVLYKQAEEAPCEDPLRPCKSHGPLEPPSSSTREC